MKNSNRIAAAALAALMTSTAPAFAWPRAVAECPNGDVMTWDGDRLFSDNNDRHTFSYQIINAVRGDRERTVTGRTPYGKVTAVFGYDGTDTIVWTNRKGDVSVQQCKAAPYEEE
jgi:hypothetical protein